MMNKGPKNTGDSIYGSDWDQIDWDDINTYEE